MWRRSRCTKFFDHLEVGYVGFIDIACPGALVSHSFFKGMSPNTSFTIEALLIDRSLGNLGLSGK
jgi:hypothetical protein